MSKHIARLIVTVLILGILGYVGYTFFFSTDINEHVYVETLEFGKSFSGKNSLESVLENLKEKNYYGNSADENGDNVIKNNENQKPTYEARQLLFSFESVETDFDNSLISENSGLLSLISELNSATLYYLTHAQFAENVHSDDVKNFNSALRSLKSSSNSIINEISNRQDGLLKRQQNSKMERVSIVKINSVYQELQSKTINHVKLQSEFLKELKDFVVSKAYKDNFIYETQGILYNSLIYTTLNLNTDLAREDLVERLYETMMITKLSNDYKQSLDLSEFEPDAELVRHYNNIVMENKNLLFGSDQDNIFSFSYEDKVEIAESGNVINKVPAKFEVNVQYLLEWLGY